jgi:predicted RNA binding protein YcfA (HicA-like mRNA interferase family)
LRILFVADISLSARHTCELSLNDRGVRGTLNQKTAIRLLEDNGWTRTKGGKHQVKMVKDGTRPITLPTHRGHDYSRGLTAAILKQAGLR